LSVPANCVAASASGTAYTCTTTPTFVPAAGDHIQFKTDVANTGSATLAVNGQTAVTIKKWGGSGNLIANDLLAAHWISATYDGAYWQLEGQLGNANATQINGAAVPAAAGVVSTNASGQIAQATGHGVFAPAVCVGSSSSTTAFACATTPTFSPVAGDSIIWEPGSGDSANSGTANAGGTAPTLNVNGAGAATIKKGAGKVNVAIGDVGKVVANAQFLAVFDGTYWDVLAPVTVHRFGYTFFGNGTALVAGATMTGYETLPFSCSIVGWSITVDAGTTTVDIWKVAASSTAIPTSAATITASAIPAIASGTVVHSTTLTGWTTAVSYNDVVGINLKASATATNVNLTVECDQ
jgi:hypothetical protein